MFVETDAAIYFYSQRDATYGFLSNFEPCAFTSEDGKRRFFSSEQFFMKQKQELFDPDNNALARKIMQAKAAAVAKRLGRQVRNYDDDLWREKRFAAMVAALKLKFSQSEEIGRRLLATGSKRLYEAAPRDAIWGVGLSVEQISAMFREDEFFQRTGDVDPETQRECFGSNLLGRALMETREWLRKQKQKQPADAENGQEAHSNAEEDHEGEGGVEQQDAHEER